MYLIDREIRAVIPQMNFLADMEASPFSVEEQIQPCSIDLRLSNKFWLPLKRNPVIDLRRSHFLDLSPRGYWKEVSLKPGECITIQPGKSINARICESFSMPSNLAGKIEGRSSFARLGLMVHCTGDFINPGWSGHMPLEIVNLGNFPIKIFPYIPICQLKLITLSGIPDKLYGESELQSKYMQDDGGPSYWWRDKRIKKLHETIHNSNVSETIRDEIIKKVVIQDPDTIRSFQDYWDKLPISQIDNSYSILKGFAEIEDKKRLQTKIAKAIGTGLFPFLVSVSVGSIFEQPFCFWHYIFWGLTLLSLPVSIFAFSFTLRNYFGEEELNQTF